MQAKEMDAESSKKQRAKLQNSSVESSVVGSDRSSVRTRGLRPWKPGQSGNPSGATKSNEIDELCAEATKGLKTRLGARLLCVLAQTALKKKTPDHVRTAAACKALDYVEGRPTQRDQPDRAQVPIEIVWGGPVPAWASPSSSGPAPNRLTSPSRLTREEDDWEKALRVAAEIHEPLVYQPICRICGKRNCPDHDPLP